MTWKTTRKSFPSTSESSFFFDCYVSDNKLPFSGYRGRQILDAAGDKSNEGSVRPPKKVKNDNKGDTAGEGGSANEGAGNNK